MITYERFKELWKKLVTDKAPTNPKIIDKGMSKHTIDALVAAADGDFSHFNKISPLVWIETKPGSLKATSAHGTFYVSQDKLHSDCYWYQYEGKNGEGGGGGGYYTIDNGKVPYGQVSLDNAKKACDQINRSYFCVDDN